MKLKQSITQANQQKKLRTGWFDHPEQTSQCTSSKQSTLKPSHVEQSTDILEACTHTEDMIVLLPILLVVCVSLCSTALFCSFYPSCELQHPNQHLYILHGVWRHTSTFSHCPGGCAAASWWKHYFHHYCSRIRFLQFFLLNLESVLSRKEIRIDPKSKES